LWIRKRRSCGGRGKGKDVWGTRERTTDLEQGKPRCPRRKIDVMEGR
jgi:hypothetical protein